MLKLVTAAVVAAATLSLAACATTDNEAVASGHYHSRDNKQGAGPSKTSSDQAVQKPLHDHREMK